MKNAIQKPSQEEFRDCIGCAEATSDDKNHEMYCTAFHKPCNQVTKQECNLEM